MFKEILTNPAGHNPNNFVYIVHSLNDTYDDMPIDKLPIPKKVRLMKKPGSLYSASLVGKLDLKTARRMFDKYTGNHPISLTDTNGLIGLILDIPCDNVICIASIEDLPSPDGQRALRKFVREYEGRINNPLRLLLMSFGAEFSSRSYNEMILRGHPLTGISGVFYQEPNYRSEAEIKQFAERANRLEGKELPLIPFYRDVEGIKTLSEKPLGRALKNLFLRKKDG
jgi:hypothetical protein